MLRPRLFLWLIAAYGLSLAGGCCCAPCLRMPCIESLDRHYPGSDDCLNGGPCGDPEDVGGMQTGMANCETCATQRQLTGGGGGLLELRHRLRRMVSMDTWFHRRRLRSLLLGRMVERSALQV